MIHAENQDKLINLQHQENVTSKVFGFGQSTLPVIPTDPKEVAREEKEENKRELKEHIFHWWHKIALILLIFHGLFGLWESIKFLFFEYPELNHLLELHQVQSSEMNHLLSRAVITTTTTLVTVFLAIRLAKVKETTAHNIDLLVATFLIISSRLIQNFLIQLDLLNLILNLFTT